MGQLDTDIPVTFEGIVNEIVELTDLSRDEVERRVWLEAVDLGWNVSRDVDRLAVTPNKYDDRMDRLYREGDGFIFETLVFWAKPDRQRWSEQAVERIYSYAARTGLEPPEVKVLVLGDGTGNDSLYLAANGFCVDYFDVPGSKTFNFAMRRFERRGVLGRGVNVLHDYGSCLSSQYDVVISFELLEHLSQPQDAIRDISLMMRSGGIALITEAFEYVSNTFPTHLETNAKYAGRTPFMFLKNNMLLSWYSKDPAFRPMEFTRLERFSARALSSLLLDRAVVIDWLRHRVRRLKSSVRRLP
jgi:2-polyprenyl-3-methyl-5-hydroxy-6-metoxy-1,4-benzoquinol methylase